MRPPLKVPRWTGRAFPVSYSLSTLEGDKKTVALRETLAAMAPHQLLCVCLLANYRSNGPYYDFLNRYHNYATYFAPYLAGLHVITAEPKRYADRAPTTSAKTRCARCRCPSSCCSSRARLCRR